MARSAERQLRIYTRTGDAGETGLVGGSRIAKHHARIEAIGDVDELNAVLGICRTHAKKSALDTPLAAVQNLLFELGAELATPQESRFVNETLENSHISDLEKWIDAQTKELEPLRNFVLPGGSPLGAHLHLARAVCRRAERSVSRLAEAAGGVRPIVLSFLNRLSDWLFVSARIANKTSGVEDVKWTSGGG